MKILKLRSIILLLSHPSLGNFAFRKIQKGQLLYTSVEEKKVVHEQLLQFYIITFISLNPNSEDDHLFVVHENTRFSSND